MPSRWLDWALTSEVPLPPAKAFAQVLEELEEALHRTGLDLSTGPDGLVTEKGRTVGRVRLWEPGRAVVLEWHPAPWHPEETTEVAIRFVPVGTGTRVTLEHRGFGSSLGDAPDDRVGWFATALLAPAIAAAGPERFGDWVTDRRARRPSGAPARTGYADPLYHRPNFLLLLRALHPHRSDRILEVGCGGGALLKELLATGARATGVDHSAEMLRVAGRENPAAVGEGRLVLVEGDAAHLPVPDAAFTVAVSTGAFQFFPDPLGALREMHRALVPGGRLALFMGTKVLVGTPACPEPIASRIRFYEGPEIGALARTAGFTQARVSEPDLGPYAKAAHLPPDVVTFFSGASGGAMLVVARKPRAGGPRRPSRGGRGATRRRSTSRRPGPRASPGARARKG
jgi:SAM-dependent methyltransferase